MKPNKFRYIGIVALFALLLVAAFWLGAFRSRAALPTYGGKTVEEWFFGDTGHPGLERTINAAQVAFNAMGTNCVPYLIDKAQTQESSLNGAYCWIYPKLPSVLQKRFKSPVSSSYIQMIALGHLQNMVSRLDYVAGDLMAIVPRLRDDSIRRQAYNTVELLAVRLDDVDKKKAYFASFLGDPDFRIQLESAIMLSRVDRSFTNGIPILVNAVTNKSLMDSTFRNPFGSKRPLPPGVFMNQAPFKQKAAYEALSKVAPLLADQYEVTK